jgi:hypothetical protein
MVTALPQQRKFVIDARSGADRQLAMATADYWQQMMKGSIVTENRFTLPSLVTRFRLHSLQIEIRSRSLYRRVTLLYSSYCMISSPSSSSSPVAVKPIFS